MTELISVIVPIYNVALYLEKCINSIIHQTYKNIEIILVDDGATDGSGAICDEYKNKDNRIKVIHKNNGGPASARKAGARIASGKYIGFVDGDDWIESEMYEKLLAYVKRDNAQVVMSGVYRDNENGVYAKWPAAYLEAGVYSKVNDSKSKLDLKLFSVNGCLNYKLFEAELVKRNLEKVDDRIHYSEDSACVWPAVLEAETVTIIDEIYYHAYERWDSATHTLHEDWYEQLSLVYMRLKEALINYTNSEVLLRQLQTLMIKRIIAGITHLFPDAHIQNYIWEEDTIFEKRRVIIYGAGIVGQSYFHQFNRSKKYEVILWVDNNWNYYKSRGMNVCEVDQINKAEFDEIIIALKREDVVEDIRNELIASGIESRRIRWKKPICLYEYLGEIEK